MTLSALGVPLVTSTFINRPIDIVIFLIVLVISVWIFRDAVGRGKSVFVAAGWAVAGIILPAITHFAYLYLRLKSEGSLSGPPVNNSE